MEATSNIAYHILNTLRESPDKPILAVDSHCITGTELHERITAVAHLLKWKGVAPNDRVLVTLPVSVDFYAITIAVFAIGGSVIIIDPSMGLERCNHCIATAKPSVWLWMKGSKYRHLKYLLPSLGSIPIQLAVADLTLPSSSKELLEPSEVIPVDHALVTFTTGSTGMPKLLLRKHSFVMNQSQSMSVTFDLINKNVVQEDLRETGAVYITNLPVFPLHFLKVGSLSLIYPSIPKCNPADIIKQAKKFNATAITGSPAFVEKVANYAIKHNITLPVKCSGVGGAPIYKGLMRTLMSVTPDKQVFVLYGSTEAEPISTIIGREKVELEGSEVKGHCVGMPVFKGSVKIIRILDKPPSEAVDIVNDYELPRGEIGEIIVSGWHVNTYQVEPSRLLTDSDGIVWLRIEDAGYMDEEGRIWLVGRVKWRVETARGTFWSVLVEQKVLDRCSLITFASYLPHKGESWLFLEAPNGLPDKEKAGLKSFLNREGIPVDHLEIRQSIPRDRRHQSKPDTAALFSKTNPNSFSKILKLFLRANPLVAVFLIFIQIMLICSVFGLYGSTEAEPISTIVGREKVELEGSEVKGHCVGMPVFKGSVKIIRILDKPSSEAVDIVNDYELPRGEIGEIIVSGWHVNTYQVLDRCSLITFASYLPHKGESWLFLEAPNGLPDKEKAGLKSFLNREGIPVDHLEIRQSIPRDRRHQSKPDTAALFSKTNPNSFSKILKLFLRANPLVAVFLIFIQIMLICSNLSDRPQLSLQSIGGLFHKAGAWLGPG